MKNDGMKGMSLLVVLGFIMSILMVFAPAGAASGRAGDFEVSVKFMDENGGTTNSTRAFTMVNITVNASLSAAEDNKTEVKVTLAVNVDEEQQSMTIGALNQGEFKEAVIQWTPTNYGDFRLDITVVNGTETSGETVTTLYYRSLASDITIDSVSLTAQNALIGIDEITITAALANKGNADGTATVTFSVGVVPLGSVQQEVPAGGSANAFCVTKFDGLSLTDGEYAVGAMMEDWQVSIKMASENITLANPAAKVAVDSLLASAASALEGTNVTLTASLNNSGTANAVNLTVDFMDGTTVVHSETNISVDMGQTKDVSYIWTLPDVAADTTKNITAKVGDSSAWVNVTIVAKVPVIIITDFTVPDGRIGDVRTFSATVKNNGTGVASGLVVEFYDSTTKLGSSTPFDLTAGSSQVVPLNVTLAGTGDVNHIFFVKAMGAEKNVTKMVGHTLAPAKVTLTAFTVSPAKKDKQPADSTQSFTLTVTMKNTGEIKSSNCTLTVKEGTKSITLTPENIALDGNLSVTKTYTWKVKGSGAHTATATLAGADTGATATLTAKCTLEYTPGFEVLFLAAAIFVAAVLVRRRKN